MSVARVARVLLAISLDPLESAERIRERVAERWEKRRCPPPSYASDDEWALQLHGLIGAPWPCPEHAVFEALWLQTVHSLRSRGLEVGRRVFGGWDDADPALARAAWCLTLHLRPERVVETGVARGLTTRFVLEAMERSGRGHVWSIGHSSRAPIEAVSRVAECDSLRLRRRPSHLSFDTPSGSRIGGR